MKVVSQALLQASRSDEEKILCAIDAIQADDYGVCDGMASVIDRPWKRCAWSAVADRLQERLEDMPLPAKDRSDWSSTFRRKRFSHRSETAGRCAEMV
jgi:hypothetical protein